MHKDETDDYTAAAEAVFLKYSDMVFRLAYSRCGGNYSDAQDITMDVFHRLMRAKPVFENDEHTRAWLVRVTINCSKSMLMNAWHRHTESMPEHIAANMDDDHRFVHDAVLSLPVKYRTAIHLFYYEDCSISKIAEAMGAKENTVKSYLRRGREMLREILKDEV
jgi:RNA polymerase sigma-70 factor (ECF subfamily)